MGRRAAEGPWPAGGSPGRWSSWPAALLTASVLSSCFLLTEAREIHVKLQPKKPQKTKSVTLTPGGKSDFVTCSWFRGEASEEKRIFTYIKSMSEQQNGPAFTGRETSGPGCSLSIKSLAVSDSEIYTVSKMVLGDTIPETGHLKVTVPEKSGLSMGVIAGIATGGLLATVLVGVLIYYTVGHLRKGGDQAV